MSLATRCTACGTVFRVVQDQLKVSEGWVRCGRCAEVFDAREQLFDLEREAPPPWPRPAAIASAEAAAPEPLDIALDDPGEAPQPAPPEPASQAYPDEEATWEMRPQTEDGSLVPQMPGYEPEPSRFTASQIAQISEWDAEEQAAQALAHAQSPAPAPTVAPPSSAQREANAALQAAVLAAQSAPPLTASSPTRVEPGLGELSADPEDSPHSVPTFLRNAPQERPPLSPGQRLRWGAAGVVLSLLLGLQLLLHFRDALAATQPAWEAPLKRVCQTLGCEVRPLQRIDALSVEGSALSHASDQGGGYQLAITLRNRAETALALPAFELSLTDTRGNLITRRVLQASDFAISGRGQTPVLAGSIAPRSEISLSTRLRTNDTRMMGYTVEVFYP